MKEWFKARNFWGAVFNDLSDEDAGRLLKAVWQYTMTGEKAELDGKIGGIFMMITATLDSDDDEIKELSGKRAKAGSAGGKQRTANQATAPNTGDEANDAEANKANQANQANEANQANAYNKNKNKIKNKNREDIEKEREREREKPLKRFSPPTVEEVAEYCKSRNNDIDPERFVAFYASKGWKVGNQPMKDWKQSVVTWEKRNKDSPPAKVVNAQKYSQRDYANEQEEAMQRMLRLMRKGA